jgi:4-amino-4-deoxy-L-arabinose transferase-like glycosyltransferase
LQFAICNFLLLLVACWFLFFYRLGDRDLWSSHEARAAQNAQTILDTGDWLIPRLYDQRPELQKPPLYYWLIASIARLRGGRVDAWAVRFPAALSAVGCVILLYFWLRSRGRPLAAILAAVVLATAVHFTWLARVGRIDMPLALAISCALAAYYQGQSYRKLALFRGWLWFLVGYLFVAVAVLLKGPIGLVLPAAVVFAHQVVQRHQRQRPPLPSTWWREGLWAGHELGLWWGLPLVLALTLPWFYWANVRTGGQLLQVFVWYHNVERGFGSEKLASHPWWFYGPRLVVDFLPWTVVLVPAVVCFCKRPDWRLDNPARFGLVWLATMITLLSCMRFKRGDYLLPAYPGAALFLGAIGEHGIRGWGKRKVAALTVPLVVACAVLGWIIYVRCYLPEEEKGRGYPRFAAEIRRLVPPPQPVILFRTKPHTLTFHLGRPVDTLLEWENLDWWAGRRGSYYVVMPPALYRECSRRLKSGRLIEVFRSTAWSDNRQERELILLRTQAYTSCPSRPHCLPLPAPP